MSTTKIIIAGSRSFTDYNTLCMVVDKAIENNGLSIIEIISGGAKGADKMGIKYAKERNIGYIEFLPDWKRFGKSAGVKRNKQMAETGNMLIAFWDGESRGTKNMIDEANKLGLTVIIQLI